jgi:hypothetical protein
MTRYRLYEWDTEFGDLLYSATYDSEDEALQALERYVSEAEHEGWDCQFIDSGRVICTLCEGEACYERELGVEKI